MKQRYLVICDSEEAYASRLMHFLSKSTFINLQVRMILSEEEVINFSAENHISILLISESFKREDIDADLIFVLTGDGGYPLNDNEEEIRKYQSGSKILKIIADKTIENKERGVFKESGSKESVICAVYSPAPSCNQHEKALKKAFKMAEKKKTLYIDSRVYGGIKNSKNSLADLVYALRQSPEAIGFKTVTCSNKVDNLRIISPMPLGLDVREVESFEWIKLYKEIKKSGFFEVIYIELCEGVNGLLKILELSEKIYMYTDKNEIDRQAQFLENMKILEKNNILDSVELEEGNY